MFSVSRIFTPNFLKSFALTGAIILSGLVSLTQPALAIKGDQQRFAVCKQLNASNSVKWHGIASGTEDSTYSIYEHSHSFHTKACFSNEKACRKWVKRIWWEIPTMDELRTAYCKPV